MSVLTISLGIFLNEGNESNFMLQPFVFIMCPCPFYLTLSLQQSSRRRCRRRTASGLWERKAPSWCQRFKPVSLVWSSLVLIFGCISAQGVIRLYFSAVLTLVQTHRPPAQRGLQRSRQRQRKSEGGCTDDAGGLLFSLLISSNLLIPILKPCYVVPLPPFMCRPELDKTQLYFTAFQPPAVHWSSISVAFTLSLHGQKNSVTSSTTGTYCYTPTRKVQPCKLFLSLLAVVGRGIS